MNGWNIEVRKVRIGYRVHVSKGLVAIGRGFSSSAAWDPWKPTRRGAERLGRRLAR